MTNYQIDCLQYANWSENIFKEMRDNFMNYMNDKLLII